MAQATVSQDKHIKVLAESFVSAQHDVNSQRKAVIMKVNLLSVAIDNRTRDLSTQLDDLSTEANRENQCTQNRLNLLTGIGKSMAAFQHIDQQAVIIANDLNNVVRGWNLLLMGYLSPDIFPSDELSSTLRVISEHLSGNGILALPQGLYILYNSFGLY